MDTWEFDGNKWSKIEVKGPTARSGAVMTYDITLKQIILFGGNPVIAKEKDYNGPMWSWNGSSWASLNSKVPLIFNSCMAYNSAENFLLRFGTKKSSRHMDISKKPLEKITSQNCACSKKSFCHGLRFRQ
jgi:hypothetical protein